MKLTQNLKDFYYTLKYKNSNCVEERAIQFKYVISFISFGTNQIFLHLL